MITGRKIAKREIIIYDINIAKHKTIGESFDIIAHEYIKLRQIYEAQLLTGLSAMNLLKYAVASV